MDTKIQSVIPLEDVNKPPTTFISTHDRRDDKSLYRSIGAKSYGTITFPDNKSDRAQFIRVSPDAHTVRVKELLNKIWCNGRPSLVISIVGGAKEYNMNPKLLTAFRYGLLKVARTTGAWIITGGMNTGIMKLVGETVQINPDRSRPIHLIGIAPWGCVSGYQQLDVHGSNVHYASQRTYQKGESPLEPNHTKFIFVDDGSERRFGGEIAFRAALEQAISDGFFASKPLLNTNLQGTPFLRSEHTEPVPVVLLVVEGGLLTIQRVHEAVVQNNIPAVFFEGTGRCCDLFAKAFRLYNEYRSKYDQNDKTTFLDTDTNVAIDQDEEIKTKLREELIDDLFQVSGQSASTTSNSNSLQYQPQGNVVDTADYFELVYECVHTRTNFLNVISLNSRNPVDPDVDLIILEALLNATSGNDPSKTNIQQKREQLHLALEWNRVDIARNFIMKNDQDWEKIDINDFFHSALDRNQIDFVKLFLDHDFSLTDLFRNHDNLLALYMKEFHHFGRVSSDPLRTIYTEIIQPLIGDFFDVDAVLRSTDGTTNSESIDEEDETSCFCCTTGEYQSAPVSDHGDDTDSARKDAGSYNDHIDADKELFLWSVITGRRDFALLFWSRAKNKICAALIATSLYKRRAQENNDDSYYQSADEFEKLAVQILDKFYKVNPHLCRRAVIRPIPAYGNITWLELAVAVEAKQFIAKRPIQDVLNNIWYGFINQRVSIRAILFSTIMPWYSGFLRYDNELVKTGEELVFLDDTIIKAHPLQMNTSRKFQLVNRITDETRTSLSDEALDIDGTSIEFIPSNCWKNTRAKIKRYFSNIMLFIHAPFVKYLYNLYFHIIFLLLFSYVILCNFFPLYEFPQDICAPTVDSKDNTQSVIKDSLITNRSNTSTVRFSLSQWYKKSSIIELILLIWVFTLVCEEIRQMVSIDTQLKRNVITAYFSEFWNQVDALAIVLFFIGFIFRFIPIAECFCAARIILSIDLAIWYIRSLSMFTAVKRLGPKLVMIGEMIQDLKFFMLLLTVFMLAYGVSSYSIVYGVRKFSWHLPRNIINHVFWQIFGEFTSLQTFESNFKANGYAAFFLLVIYMIVVSILLINLLIAMFSYTFDRVQTDGNRIWKYQRYLLVSEYFSRPALPPPLIFFSHIWHLSLYLLTRCIKSYSIQRIYKPYSRLTKYKIQPREDIAWNIEKAEDEHGDEIYYNNLKESNHSELLQEQVLSKIEALENRIQTINTSMAHSLEYQEFFMDALKRILSGQNTSSQSRSDT